MNHPRDIATAETSALPPRLPSASPNRLVGSVIGFTALAVACLALFIFNPAEHGFYPRCYFHQTTGLQCPGCGGLRAMHQILHGHLLQALKLNALAVIALPFGVGWLWRAWWEGRRGVRARRTFQGRWFWFVLVVLMGFSLLRNLPAFACLSP